MDSDDGPKYDRIIVVRQWDEEGEARYYAYFADRQHVVAPAASAAEAVGNLIIHNASILHLSIIRINRG